MNEPAQPPRTLREMARASVREQIAASALQLFDRDGFDETTVDDIAAEIGLSARSFFRYFPSKEDVVVGDPAEFGERIRDRAAERPPDEPPWEVLRRSLDPVAESAIDNPAYGLLTMRVMMSTPGLRARNLEKHSLWSALLVPVIEARPDPSGRIDGYRARVLVNAALSCLDVALAEWVRHDATTSFAAALDEAFDVLSGSGAR